MPFLSSFIASSYVWNVYQFDYIKLIFELTNRNEFNIKLLFNKQKGKIKTKILSQEEYIYAVLIIEVLYTMLIIKYPQD